MQIQVGNFNQTIATLQLGGSETAIIVSIVICSVLLLLSVVGKAPYPRDTVEGRAAPPVPAPLMMGTEGIRGWGNSLNKGLGVETGCAPRGGVRSVPTAQTGDRR